MNTLGKVKPKPSRVFGPVLVFLMLFAVACGGAAEPTSAPPATAPTQAVAQPTAVPEVMEEMMEEPAVNPGKVIWMTGGWGNERFDPAFAPGGDPNQYGRLMTGYLVEISDDFELIPGMATDWTISEDGLTWTVTLRDGVKFHDGTEVTTDDIAWSWDHWYSHESRAYTQSGALWGLENIFDKIEQTGPDQVSITTDTPHTGIPDYYFSRRGPLFAGAMPKRDTIANEAEEIAYDKNPIGTGSFKLVRHVQAEVMEFERFDDYYYQPKNGFSEDRRPQFTSFDLRSVPEEAVRVAAIRAGEADIAPVTLQAREQVEKGGGRIVFGQEGVYFYFIAEMCWADPEVICYDKRVRQALAYAMDLELMRDSLYGAEAMVIKGWNYVTPSTIGYTPGVDPFPFDPDKARELMAEAGYKTPTNPEGKDPGTLVINTLTSPSLPLLPEASQLIAANWEKELGIDVDVRVSEKVALEGAEDAGELVGQYYFRDNEARVDGRGITRGRYGNPERLSRAHNSPELFALVDDAIAIADPVEQLAALENMYQRLRDEEYHLAVGYLNIPWAVGPRILEWESRPLSLFPNNLHKLVLE